MEQTKQELFKVLRAHGAALCGVADMGGFTIKEGLETGISVAVPVPAHVVEDLKTAPTLEYRDTYDRLNRQLDEIVTAGADFLEARGFRAWACTLERMKRDENWRAPIPHKTFATWAGLGWIGKSCLLVTPEYGSAVRISSLLTDAPLPAEQPITESKCGGCTQCVDNCPGQALKDTLWKAGMDRGEILDKEACEQAEFRRMEEATGLHVSLCGKCFAVCPYTQRWLRSQHRL